MAAAGRWLASGFVALAAADPDPESGRLHASASSETARAIAKAERRMRASYIGARRLGYTHPMIKGRLGWWVLALLFTAACEEAGNTAPDDGEGGAHVATAPRASAADAATAPSLSVDAGAGAFLLEAAHMIDGVGATARDGVAVLVLGARIQEVGPRAALEAKAGATARRIDLGDATLLPGLMDAHTHVLLQGDVTAADYDEQLLKESIPYRAIRATAAVRIALMNGFTTLRDLETEGAMYADVDLKHAIERGVVPGPRLFVSTRALAPTGTYPLLGYSWELKVPEGVQITDGVDAVRHAVREQVKYGADWIKFYADRHYTLGPDAFCAHALCSSVNYTDEEAKALVDEAHRLGKKVAAHAMGWNGIDAALRAGVDSIEHGDGLDDELIRRMVQKGVYWCPTLYVGVYVAPGRGGIWPKMVEIERVAFGKAVKAGVLIAYGTDVGGYPWTENQAKEVSIMVRYGMPAMDAIKSATAVDAKLLGQSAELGTLEAGKQADIIAVPGDPVADPGVLERVSFVMKEGVVYKGGGDR
jgi:imidazolonepropionase-like amidohydrolase